MKITRIYTGPDNRSHFEDREIPLKDGGNGGFMKAAVSQRSASWLMVIITRSCRPAPGKTSANFTAALFSTCEISPRP